MKRYLTLMALSVAMAVVATPAYPDYMTANPGGPSFGSYNIGSDGTGLGNMIGASFVVANGSNFNMTGVGGAFDGNFNNLPGLGEQKIFVAIVSLSDGSALPSFSPSDIAAHTIVSSAFAPPMAPGDFTVSTNVVLGPGAYAAIFGSGGLLGSDAAGQAGLEDGNLTIGTPNIFSNFTDSSSWSSYGFDTGIRIFETGTLAPVPEPSGLAILSMGLFALMAAGWRRAGR
jgi:hypothetical protein